MKVRFWPLGFISSVCCCLSSFWQLLLNLIAQDAQVVHMLIVGFEAVGVVMSSQLFLDSVIRPLLHA